ncbi:MAG: HNH endonuclease signature motif containing protein [Yaniella sp.]
MELTSLLPNVGAPVPTDILNLDKLSDASLGEMVHAGTQLLNLIVATMNDPTTYDTIPTFITQPGGDWNGYQPQTKSALNDQAASPEMPAKSGSDMDGVVAPENFYDTLQALGLMFGRLEHLTEAANTLYASYVSASMSEQQRYFGTPYDVSPFRDDRQYLRQTRGWSGAKTTKHLQRAPLVTHTPGGDPNVWSSHPTYPAVAESFTSGRLSAENLDRILGMHTELHDYAGACDVPPGMVDQVMAAFEPVLAEAGENVSPEELSAAKKGWMDQIAHELNADGPSPSQALRKPPDNAIKTKSFPEGGGRISINATPEVYDQFKNFVLHMLKADNTPPDIPQDIRNLIHPTDGNEHDDRNAAAQDDSVQPCEETKDESAGQSESSSDDRFPSVDEVPDNIDDLRLDDAGLAVGEDAQGNTYTANNLQDIDPLSSGQKIAAMLIGMFRTILRMDPAEIGVKKSHGASAQLVIVQDVQTAYRALGVPPLPPDVQRPPGPAGMTPPVIRRPNPDTSQHSAPGGLGPERVGDTGGHESGEPAVEGNTRFLNQFPWAPYRSEALNHGSIHPADAEILSCDSELVAQLWDGPDTVLNQKRTQRLFTVAQRRAILARDRGCQAPGCTISAVFCDIHHIKDWLAGGNTSVTNAVTLCSHHHAATHIGKWRIRKVDGFIWFQPAPWLDPYQPLLRNLYWNR